MNEALVRHHGFTLIEVIIAIVLIAILASVAVPAYQDYVRKGRRTDAMTALMNLHALQEKWRTNNPTYGTLANLGVSATSPDGHYTIAISTATASAFTATATVRSGGLQESDAACQVFTLTEAGPDLSTAAKKKCWNR